MEYVIALDPKSIGGIRCQAVQGPINTNPILSPFVESGINKLILGLEITTDDNTAGTLIQAYYELPGQGALWIPLSGYQFTLAAGEHHSALRDFWLPSGWRIGVKAAPGLAVGKTLYMTWAYIDVLQI